MTPEAFDKRYAELIAEESTNEETLWYLSFADEKFNGAVIVMAKGFIHACVTAKSLKINPGGEVVGGEYKISSLWPDKKWWNRLLQKKDIDEMDVEFHKVEEFRKRTNILKSNQEANL
jgi:hypothetical protein